ncbi:hypothetical protein L218DRAFT_988973 [Marasmius fiardii PR-910]|nr:hypothetical protein L218DRAFT_988973 [Marasmius fiardii PR-910]
MSDRFAPAFTIPTHFDNPAQPCLEFTPTPFDTECPTGIPPVFNKDDYPPLDGESWKDHQERLWKEEDRVDTESKRIKRALQDFEDLKEEHKEQEEGQKVAYEADLENWEQEEELRQRKLADYIACAQREVEERKREEQRRASAVADASTDTLASAENLDEAESEESMKLIADDPVFQAGIETGYQQRVAEEEEGQKTWKGKGKERLAETKLETDWVASKKRCVDCVKYDTTCRVLASGRAQACAACKKHKSKYEESLHKTMEEGFSDVVISNETQMDIMEEKVDKMVSLLAENLEVQKQILASLRKPRFDRVIVPPVKKKGSKSDKRPGPEEAEASKSSKKRKRGDDDDEEYEGESEKE